MLNLAIETSRMSGGVALLDGDKPLSQIIFNLKATYSEKLLYAISILLKNALVRKEDIELITISEGPGSFTGLRIGMTIAKSIAYAQNIPIVPVNSLLAYTDSIGFEGKYFAPFFDARKSEIFGAVFTKKNGEWKEIYPTGAYAPAHFFDSLKQYDGELFFLGDIEKFSSFLDSKFKSSILFEGTLFSVPTSIGRLGYKKFLKGERFNLFELEPKYYRLSDAEINYEKNKKNN